MGTSKQTPAAETVADVRDRVRHAVAKAGFGYEELGLRMGYTKGGARQAVWRLLNAKGYDPRLSTLVALAQAVGCRLTDLLS
jgi:hypothetical protein